MDKTEEWLHSSSYTLDKLSENMYKIIKKQLFLYFFFVFSYTGGEGGGGCKKVLKYVIYNIISVSFSNEYTSIFFLAFFTDRQYFLFASMAYKALPKGSQIESNTGLRCRPRNPNPRING